MSPPSRGPRTPGVPPESAATDGPTPCRSPNESVSGTDRFEAAPCASFWCDDKPRTRGRDDRGYGLPLVTTDLESSAEDLVARYASRWGIEQAFADARQIMGVGEARNRTRCQVPASVETGFSPADGLPDGLVDVLEGLVLHRWDKPELAV